MHTGLPQYFSGHVAAFTGVLMLHGGLIAWQMVPTSPVVLPQQQVIKVAMVSARMVQPRPQPEPAVQEMTPPAVPPKAEGMKKVAPKPQAKAPLPEPAKKVEESPVQEAQPAALQPEEANNRNAALTEPVAAAYLKNPPPVYPRAALRRKQQGTVMIAVLVDTDGLPMRVSLDQSSGHEALDDAALEAVRKWKFVPARRGSELVEASVVVPVEFRIN